MASRFARDLQLRNRASKSADFFRGYCIRTPARRRVQRAGSSDPEICTYVETLEEARQMAQDAIRCFLESAIKTGEPIPADVAEVTTERAAVTIP